MRIPGWSCLLIGFLFTTIACQPIADENGNRPYVEPAVTFAVEPTAVARQPTATSDQPKPTPTPPPKPTAEPTSDFFKNWQTLSDSNSNVQLAIPPDWENLSGSLRLDSTVLSSRLGLLNLLATNSSRAGSSLLASKDIQVGAFLAGLLTNLDLPQADPVAALSNLLADMEADERLVGHIAPFSAPGISGAFADILGNPILFPTERGENLVTRLLFLVTEQGQILYLFSATRPEWERYQPLFEQMIGTIRLTEAQSSGGRGGARHVAGVVQSGQGVNGRLEYNVNDIWSFSNSGPAYATITLRPEANNLDLVLTIIDPAGQTVSRIDRGYAGDMETAVDLLLTDTGLYLIEVSEFFSEAGRYTLDLSLSPSPLYSGGGRIQAGQSIQSNLPANGQHYWTFSGSAGDLISIVLQPDARFDAILNLYGPDGRQLVVLDEGFSGDAEILSGLQLPADGEYTIMVLSFAGNAGSYTLSLDEGGESTANFYDAGDLTYGEVHRENLRAFEAHAWFFNGKTGDMVMIEVKPLNPTLDLEIWLLDTNINRLAARDNFLQGENELLDLSLPQDGQYLILVRDYNGAPGDYEIRLAALPVATPVAMGNLTVGESQTGVLQPGQTLVFYFDGTQNETIRFDLAVGTPASDFNLTILDPDGRAFTRVDEGQAGEPESYSLLLPRNGRWGIMLKEFFDEGGSYTLTLSRQ